MKRALILSVLLVGSAVAGNGSPAQAGRCSGGANCTACSTCSACRNCAGGGGTCSVCEPVRYALNTVRVQPASKRRKAHLRPRPHRRQTQKASRR
jgi:hypothetical protein